MRDKRARRHQRGPSTQGEKKEFEMEVEEGSSTYDKIPCFTIHSPSIPSLFFLSNCQLSK